jgi:hypothetical protein
LKWNVEAFAGGKKKIKQLTDLNVPHLKWSELKTKQPVRPCLDLKSFWILLQ